jgi:hypothetical protein
MMYLTTKSLRDGLVTLPQELYDQFYKEVFTSPDPELRWINWKWRIASGMMSISHASRELYAASYYNGSFKFSSESMTLISWLNVVPRHHRSLIQKITVYGPPDGMISWWPKHEPLLCRGASGPRAAEIRARAAETLLRVKASTYTDKDTAQKITWDRAT